MFQLFWDYIVHYIWNWFIKVGWFMRIVIDYFWENITYSYYLLHINIAIVTASDVWMDLTLMISKISINKKTWKISGYQLYLVKWKTYTWRKKKLTKPVCRYVFPVSTLLLLLLLLNKVGSAGLWESDIHPISPKTLPHNTNQ